MSRGAKPRRSKVQSVRRPWKAAYAEAFGLAGDWTPPAEIILRTGGRTLTLVADFTRPDGRQVRLTTRVDPVDGSVLSESMSVSFCIGAAR